MWILLEHRCVLTKNGANDMANTRESIAWSLLVAAVVEVAAREEERAMARVVVIAIQAGYIMRHLTGCGHGRSIMPLEQNILICNDLICRHLTYIFSTSLEIAPTSFQLCNPQWDSDINFPSIQNAIQREIIGFLVSQG